MVWVAAKWPQGTSCGRLAAVCRPTIGTCSTGTLTVTASMDDRNPWQELRALRAVPPGLAAKDVDRRAVLSASLQQAQELADATAASGYATKALPLFYCFSQGLRAIAAARRVLSIARWRYSGSRRNISSDGAVLLCRGNAGCLQYIGSAVEFRQFPALGGYIARA
jgi:hypothetical protein